ncbi:MAG: ATP-binding cassette domain-containing protein, partial [Flavitalea sp.]
IKQNAAEASTSKLKQVHADKIEILKQTLKEAASLKEVQNFMKAYFENSNQHKGKIQIEASGINYAYPGFNNTWTDPKTFVIKAGDRIRISGDNGSGKSTLFGLLQQKLRNTEGTLKIASQITIALDQDYTMIDRDRTVLEQAIANNSDNLEPSTIHTILANFLFFPESWDKPCKVLSGGEMLRLSLCCMVLRSKQPDIILLDEPVNNLDLANIKMLGSIFRDYKGTLLVISHDEDFINDLGIEDEIRL